MSVHVWVEVQAVVFDVASILFTVCGGIRVVTHILVRSQKQRRGR
jgi:uncharacterized membrane protein